MNIVFMGSPEFAIPSLTLLHESHHTIQAVVSNRDKRRGRGSDTQPTPVKAKALELGLTVIEVDDLHDPAFADQIKALEPDLLVVVAFRILPASVLAIPAIGSVNLHASLLPQYRGAAPIHRAVMNGETETGCTIFFLDERVDTGKIILQEHTGIGPDETTGEVYERLMHSGANTLMKAVDAIESGESQAMEQNDTLATPAPKLFREDAHIDFDRSAEEVHNHIRGLSPFPGAWAMLDDEKLNIYRSARTELEGLQAGVLHTSGERLFVGCADGALELLEIQLPGKKRMFVSDFLKGNEISGTLN